MGHLTSNLVLNLSFFFFFQKYGKNDVTTGKNWHRCHNNNNKTIAEVCLFFKKKRGEGGAGKPLSDLL